MESQSSDAAYRPSHHKKALSECPLTTRSKDKIRPSLGPDTSNNMPGTSAVDTTGAGTDVQSVLSNDQTMQPLMMSATATNVQPQPSTETVSQAGAPARVNANADN